MGVRDWSKTAASNTTINTIGVQGTNKASNFDNAFREHMAQVATWRDEIVGKGADIASAATLTLGSGGNYFDVTGTTTITAISGGVVGYPVYLQFDGALTLTHHATDLILPTGNDITTEAGDHACFLQYASGDWRLLWYMRERGFSGANSEGLTAYGACTDAGVAHYAGTFNVSSIDDNSATDGKDFNITNAFTTTPNVAVGTLGICVWGNTTGFITLGTAGSTSSVVSCRYYNGTAYADTSGSFYAIGDIA